MMSTKHTGELVDTSKTHFQTKQNILKPDVIREYNATMGVRIISAGLLTCNAKEESGTAN